MIFVVFATKYWIIDVGRWCLTVWRCIWIKGNVFAELIDSWRLDYERPMIKVGYVKIGAAIASENLLIK